MYWAFANAPRQKHFNFSTDNQPMTCIKFDPFGVQNLYLCKDEDGVLNFTYDREFSPYESSDAVDSQLDQLYGTVQLFHKMEMPKKSLVHPYVNFLKALYEARSEGMDASLVEDYFRDFREVIAYLPDSVPGQVLPTMEAGFIDVTSIVQEAFFSDQPLSLFDLLSTTRVIGLMPWEKFIQEISAGMYRDLKSLDK